MKRVAARDAEAQERLVRRLAGRVRRVARMVARTEAEADDAAQVALLEILRSAGRFRIEASLEHWADRLTVRAVLRADRRERRRTELMRRWLVPGTLPWGAELSSRAKEPPDIRAVLARLSPERREALVLRHALGYTTEEIADATNVPLGTVKDRLVSARKLVRQSVEREHRRLAQGGPRD